MLFYCSKGNITQWDIANCTQKETLLNITYIYEYILTNYYYLFKYAIIIKEYKSILFTTFLILHTCKEILNTTKIKQLRFVKLNFGKLS